jgi:uncharacterized protein (DUF58 family)
VITRRGWAVIAGSIAMAGAGRTFGVLELFALAAGGIGLVGVALAAVLLRRNPHLTAARRLVPQRVHAGADSRVELMVRNDSTRPSPVVTLRDAVVLVRPEGDASTATRQARFHVAPLEPEASNRAAYRLGADRRGLYRVGPLNASVTDPFGLVSTTREIAPVTELTVLPRVEVVMPLPLTTGHDPRAGGGHPTFLGTGDEFFALREYEVGDDLRRVHWPSTARRDELMIRQHEMPFQGRATVLVDVRAGAHAQTAESLEQVVSAGASLLTAAWQLDSQIRLLTTGGLDSGFGSGPAHLHAMMEHLAVVEAGADRLDTLIAALRRQPTGALVVVTTTSTTVAALETLTSARTGFGWVAAVLVAPRPGDTRAVPPNVLAVRVDPGQPLAPAWNRAMSAPSASTLRVGR